MNDLPDTVKKVQTALQQHGVSAQFRILPDSAHTAQQAASALGCELDQIAKSIIFKRLDNALPVLVIACGGTRINEETIKLILGVAIVKADATFVRECTGFAIGGIPPLGHHATIQIIFDRQLLRFDEVWAAAGTPQSVFCVSPLALSSVPNCLIAGIE